MIILFLLICIVGDLALTTSEYVNCKDLCPDEFLDFALVCQGPTLPVLASYRNTHPLLLWSLKRSSFRETNLLTIFMRC
jgi:hypothetical protein